MKAPQYLLMVIAGLAACAWGFPMAHRFPFPKNLFPAILTLLGAAMLLLGSILTVLPQFFQG